MFESLQQPKGFQDFLQVFKLFPSLLLDCTVFSTSYPQIWPTYRVLGGVQHSKLCLFWNYHV